MAVRQVSPDLAGQESGRGLADSSGSRPLMGCNGGDTLWSPQGLTGGGFGSELTHGATGRSLLAAGWRP